MEKKIYAVEQKGFDLDQIRKGMLLVMSDGHWGLVINSQIDCLECFNLKTYEIEKVYPSKYHDRNGLIIGMFSDFFTSEAKEFIVVAY